MISTLTCLSCVALWTTGSLLSLTASAVAAVPTVIPAAVNQGQPVTLAGNVHRLARPEFDQGAAPQDLPMDRMLLVLKRSPQQDAALAQLLADQQNSASPGYHQWLTPEGFGDQFGLADEDLQRITSWLQSQGFSVDHIAQGRNLIEFSGTAGQVQNTFHTAIHKFVVNGEEHWANVSNPQIPAALLPGVAGITSLHNFLARPQLASKPDRLVGKLVSGSPRPQFGSGGSQALAPADYATIYNINPAYTSGINGAGTVIAIVGRTNINAQDVISFRAVFGLPNKPPVIIVNGRNPGDLGGGEEVEAVLDTSWSGAIAPNAQIDLVVSATTNSTDGVTLSEEYIIDNNLANVMSESFGDCEANYTQSSAATISSLAQQAAAEGITYAVSAGDNGSAGCDDDSESVASGPLSVNILAATPYTTAVGGTQFDDNANPSEYWSSQNSSSRESALSYIPEDVWNSNCFESSCGSGSILAGSGGRSTFFSKPYWQSGVAGIPNDGVRDVPDVALTAAGHDPYLLCLDGSCTPDARGDISFAGVYGTSAAAPSFAGMMALVNQKTGSRQGLANARLYALAASSNLTSCSASNTSTLPSGSCIFHDVTVGTNAVPGERNYNTASETYLAAAGYDLATGLGSVNAANLVNNWSSTGTALSGMYQIVSKNSGMCLNVAGASTAQSAPMIQWACGSYTNEYFTFTPVTGGYEITAKNSGLCLNVWGNSYTQGAPIIQYPYLGSNYTNEVWTVSAPDSQGYVTIAAVSSGQVLSVNNSALNSGATVIQWGNYEVPAQKWKLVQVQ